MGGENEVLDQTESVKFLKRRISNSLSDLVSSSKIRLKEMVTFGTAVG
jgi:hypothetical protein